MGGIGSGRSGSGRLPGLDGRPIVGLFFIWINGGRHLEWPLENQINADIIVQVDSPVIIFFDRLQKDLCSSEIK